MTAIFAARVNPAQSRLLQLALFERGYFWGTAGKHIAHTEHEYLCPNDDKILCYANTSHVKSSIPITATFEQAMEWAITGVKFWKEPVKLKISNYDTVVNPGNFIQIGCKKIEADEIQALVKAFNNVVKSNLTKYQILCNNTTEALTLVSIAAKFGYYDKALLDMFLQYKRKRQFTIYFNLNINNSEIGWDFHHQNYKNASEITYQEALNKLVDGSMKDKSIQPIDYNSHNFNLKIYPGNRIENITDGNTITKEEFDKLLAAYQS